MRCRAPAVAMLAIGVTYCTSGDDSREPLNLCGLYEDTYGQWLDYSGQANEEEKKEIWKHFLGDPGETMRFHKVQREGQLLS